MPNNLNPDGSPTTNPTTVRDEAVLIEGMVGEATLPVNVEGPVTVTGTVTVEEPLTVTGTVAVEEPITVTGSVIATDPAPLAADIVGGRATAAGGVLLTVPAGRVWKGRVSVSASVIAGINAAAASQTVRVDLAGTGVAPSAGSVIELSTSTPLTTATATSGAAAKADGNMDLTIRAGSTDATLTLQHTGMTQVRANANGVLSPVAV